MEAVLAGVIGALVTVAFLFYRGARDPYPVGSRAAARAAEISPAPG
jgi:hypothetical protein